MFYKLLDRPVSVMAILTMLVVPGIAVTGLFPVSLLPDIDVPEITVKVDAPGMSAVEINSNLMNPLTRHIGQIEGIDDLECRSVQGSGTVSIRFGYGSRKGNWKYIEVNEQIDRAMSEWPQNVERPMAAKASVSDIPSFFINVTSDSRDITAISDVVRNVIIRRLEQLPQIAMVDLTGLAETKISIIPDMASMTALGIDDEMLKSAIAQAGMEVGSVLLKENGLIYEVFFEPALIETRDIGNIWLNINGRMFRLSDIASVHEQAGHRDNVVLSDGKESVSMAIIKNRDSGMNELRRELDKLLSAMEADYPELGFTVSRDQTELLDFSIRNMVRNILSGAFFACAVLFLFYRNYKSPLMVLISVPLSLAISFLILYMMGISVNVISLSGLVLGIGMMVDNSIIVVGNISRRIAGGENLRNACVMGTREVFAPLLSSLLTTCSMFLPLAFLSGMAGTMFRDEALSVTVTLFSSLAVSVLVVPLLFHVLKPDNGRFADRFSHSHRLTDMLIRRRWVMWGIFLLMDSALIIIPRIPISKLPNLTRTETLMLIDWKRPVSVSSQAELCSRICKAVGPEHFTVMSGTQDFLLSHTPSINGQNTLIYLKCSDESALNHATGRIESMVRSEWPQASFRLIPAGNAVDMVFPDSEDDLVLHLRPSAIDGNIMDKASALIDRLSGEFPNSGIEHVRTASQLVVNTDVENLARYGLTGNDVVSRISRRLEQHPFMVMERGQSSLPVIMQTAYDTDFLEYLSQGTVRNAAGAEIPLHDLVSFNWTSIPMELFTGPEGDYLRVPMKMGSHADRQLAAIKRTVLEDGNFEVGFSGAYFSGHSLFGELAMVLAISVMLLYLILAAQFGNMFQPVIVLLELVVDISFVLVVLLIFGESLNVMSMTGIIVMCGIVINDSILKIDTINRLRSEGKSMLRAVLEAGRIRNGAIVTTSATTILAMVPFLVRGDIGSDLQFPLSLTIIAGMSVGTVVSLYAVPAVCYAWGIKKQASGTSQLRSSLNKI